MSLGLTHSGAIARGLGYVPTPAAQRAAKTDETPNVSAVKPGRPAPTPAQAREQIRQQVLAEHGYDLLELYRMGSMERIQTETEIAAETAERTRQVPVRATGTFIDLRV